MMKFWNDGPGARASIIFTSQAHALTCLNKSHKAQDKYYGYMMAFFMFGDGSWVVAFISTPSTGNGNINRITFAFVKGNGPLLQNLVTYYAEKSVAFVIIYLHMLCLS